MGLETLHLVERRQPGVRVVEPDHETVRHQVLAEMIQPRAAIRGPVQRPAEAVLHQPRPVVRRRDLPQLLDAEPVGLRIHALAQAEPGHQLLGERAAAAFAEQGVGGPQLHPGSVVRAMLAVAGHAHIADGDADYAAILLQQLGSGEAGVDLDPQRLGLAAQPLAYLAQADDVVAVIVHVRHHRAEHRDPVRAGLGEEQHVVFGRQGVQRRSALVPARDQLVQRPGLDHRPGQDVRADLGALLHHADGSVRRQLLQPDRRGQSGGTGSHHHHVELHHLALGHSQNSPSLQHHYG